MAINRKLGRTTDIRNSMLKTLTTDLILHGKIETTETRAKEVKAIADSVISLAIKEKDNYETVEVKVVKAKLDSKGNKVTELTKSKNGNEYLKVVKEEKLEGIQLYAGAFDPLMDAYMITAIPHFILIDREGKVINAKMSRPSDPETVKFLDALEGL